MATPEGKASQNVKLRANELGCRLYKNNTGVAYNSENRPVFFGLGNEGKKGDDDIRTPDWIGWRNTIITQEMVGKSLPIFVAIDAKKVGFKQKIQYPVSSREHGQQKFFNIVDRFNGINGFAATAEDVDRIINNFIFKATSK
jgi:hypothetical protein